MSILTAPDGRFRGYGKRYVYGSYDPYDRTAYGRDAVDFLTILDADLTVTPQTAALRSFAKANTFKCPPGADKNIQGKPKPTLEEQIEYLNAGLASIYGLDARDALFQLKVVALLAYLADSNDDVFLTPETSAMKRFARAHDSMTSVQFLSTQNTMIALVVAALESIKAQAERPGRCRNSVMNPSDFWIKRDIIAGLIDAALESLRAHKR